jgi:hypothetical protein
MAAAAPSVLHAQRGTLPRPATRAERTNYAETSHHADVIAFLDSLVAMRAPLVVTELGRSTEGRVLPLVIASKPQVRTPAEARALGRPIVYVQANIHAGEVEGKESVQALLRELSVATGPTVLDSLVLLVVPIYNADGNERFGDQARNRGAQNGPALIGLRPERAGARPQSRLHQGGGARNASLARGLCAVGARRVHGSAHHERQLSRLSPHLLPVAASGAPLAPFVGDTLLVTIRERMQARHGSEVFPVRQLHRRTPRVAHRPLEKSRG